MDKSYAEISFGRVIKDKIGKPLENKKYAIYHWEFDNGKRILNPGFIITDISLEYLMGYLEGSLLNKQLGEFYLYNGISNVSRQGFFPKCEFTQLDDSELEELVKGVKKINKILIKTII